VTTEQLPFTEPTDDETYWEPPAEILFVRREWHLRLHELVPGARLYRRPYQASATESCGIYKAELLVAVFRPPAQPLEGCWRGVAVPVLYSLLGLFRPVATPLLTGTETANFTVTDFFGTAPDEAAQRAEAFRVLLAWVEARAPNTPTEDP